MEYEKYQRMNGDLFSLTSKRKMMKGGYNNYCTDKKMMYKKKMMGSKMGYPKLKPLGNKVGKDLAKPIMLFTKKMKGGSYFKKK